MTTPAERSTVGKTVGEDGPFRVGEPVWAAHPDGPRYGEQFWDLRRVVERANDAQRGINFRSLPVDYRQTCIELLMVLANPDHPNVMAAGIVRRARPAPVATIYTNFLRLRTITAWAAENGLRSFAHWTQHDADTFLIDLRAGRHRDAGDAVGPSTQAKYVDMLKLVRECGPVLPHGLTFMPWGARSAPTVTGYRAAGENLTAPLPWPTWAPTVAAAWAFVDRFSTDILTATRELRADPPRGPASPVALSLIRNWVNRGGRIPLHTGYGHNTNPRGEPNYTLLCRQVGISRNIFRKSHTTYQPDAVTLVESLAADPRHTVFGGLVTPTVTVTHPDGKTSGWVGEIGAGEARYLSGALRAACYIVLASLTGMRDSELQELTRDAPTTRDGLPALHGVQFKGRTHPSGAPRAWWAPLPVMRAVEVLSQLSEHPSHLFARNRTEVGAYCPHRDITRLMGLVNDPPMNRPGRGRGLALEAIDTTALHSINATTLRRSLAVYAATRPGAELGLGIQLGHAAWRTTTGYTSDGREQAVRHFDNARLAVVRDQARELIEGTAPVAGHPARQIHQFRAQVVTDPDRADRIAETLIDRLHFGLTNDCMFDGATAACHPTRPHLGDHICAGHDCTNALFTEQHRPVLADAIERIDTFLDRSRGNPNLLAQMRRDRTNLVRLLRELTPTPDQDQEGVSA